MAGTPTRIPVRVEAVAIIGTRKPDGQQSLLARQLAIDLSSGRGWRIHTGGADGVDTEAAKGTPPSMLTVFLPWAAYNQYTVPKNCTRVIYNPGDPEHDAWSESVRKYHPKHYALSRGAFALHARNYGIVYQCKWVVALPNESGEGGTGQGIRIARALGIPCIIHPKGTILSAPAVLEEIKGKIGFPCGTMSAPGATP